MDKLVAISGGAAQDALAEALRKLEKNFELVIRYHDLQAKILWARYNALQNEGFSKAEALELCKGTIV